MPETVTLRRHDCTHDRVVADSGILQELSERFTFYAEGYKFNPKYKARVWDGKIRMMSPFNPYLYCGLRDEVRKFCEASGYELKLDGIDAADAEFSVKECNDFLDTLGLPETINGRKVERWDHQVEAIVRAVRKERVTILSPTASGKSMIIYGIVRYFAVKTLIIVPSLNLINQMKSDFVEYGLDPDFVHQIYSGQEKQTKKPIVVSTWQSLRGIPESYLSQFSAVIVDEVHGAKAKELKEIMEKMRGCGVRIGLSGTLDDIEANKLTIQGLFGPIYQAVTTSELIASGKLAELEIKSIILEHTEDNRRKMSRAKYPDEMKYLIESEARNRFIKNLALSLKGNTLVLFQYVEKHGEPLRDLIQAEAQCPVLYVSGNVDADEREEIRKFVNGQTQSVTVASKGCFSTGVNIPNLDNIIFASPSKARIQTLQSIGRGLRKSDRKSSCVLYDVADNLTWGEWTNHTLNHFVERARIYRSEKFKHKSYPVKLKD